MGLVAGPPLAKALKASFGDNVAVQGVKYPASIPGYLKGGDNGGEQTMAQLVEQAASKCPNTKIVMSGYRYFPFSSHYSLHVLTLYSQGGYIVHKAANQLTASAAKHVKAIVIFGDPMQGQAMKNISPSIVDTICHEGDEICQAKDVIKATHLTYGKDAGSAAAFVKKALGSAGSSSSSSSKPKPKPVPAKDSSDDSDASSASSDMAGMDDSSDAPVPAPKATKKPAPKKPAAKKPAKSSSVGTESVNGMEGMDDNSE
jgi:cutinase